MISLADQPWWGATTISNDTLREWMANLSCDSLSVGRRGPRYMGWFYGFSTGRLGVTEPDVGYRYTEVEAYNSKGARRVVEVADTDEEANRRIFRIENDFKALTIQQWCERYDIPLSFVTE